MKNIKSLYDILKGLSGECIKIMVEKFNKNTTKTGTCWIYNGPKYGDGYGGIKIPGVARSMQAHRFSYFIHKGRPEDFKSSYNYVCHTCNNRRCVNPDHLYLGTAMTNALDREASYENNNP